MQNGIKLFNNHIFYFNVLSFTEMQARGHRRREVAKCHVSHEGKGQRGQRKC